MNGEYAMPVTVKVATEFDSKINQAMRETHRFLSVIELKKPELMDHAASLLQSLNDNLRQALVQQGVDPTPRAPANINESEQRAFVDAWLRRYKDSNAQEAEREYLRIKSEEVT
jgi:hypothetical protein